MAWQRLLFTPCVCKQKQKVESLECQHNSTTNHAACDVPSNTIAEALLLAWHALTMQDIWCTDLT